MCLLRDPSLKTEPIFTLQFLYVTQIVAMRVLDVTHAMGSSMVLDSDVTHAMGSSMVLDSVSSRDA
jgi:hypothetical protein